MSRDQEHRSRAARDTGDSFIVEASAGTGKTRTLVERILNLVLHRGPQGPPIPLSSICAITFTEKAAGEMKLRLRQKLEEAARIDSTREKAQQALYDLETAAISTFHSLAVSLLRERPIEAELDPQFRALDEIQSQFFFDDLWEEWIRDVLVGRKGSVEAALRGGLTLDGLKSIAACLRLHAALVSRLDTVPAVPEEQARLELKGLLGEAEALVPLALNPEDVLHKKLEAAIGWLRDPSRGEQLERAGNCGKAASWVGGADAVCRVKELVWRIVEHRARFLQYGPQRLLDEVVRWLLAEFIPVWRKQKQAEGILDFDDQLETARTLLRRSRAARREFHERYRTLLVDEFQDTDPIQLDIVLLLACPDLDETDPARMKPAPGRLFIVGDPKQSIYRFRGADVETYLKVVAGAEARGLHHLELSTNFRSVPSILRFVDAAFEGVMTRTTDGDYQGNYLAFGPGDRQFEPAPPSVRLVGSRGEDGRLSGCGKGYVALEASRLARLILQIRGSARWGIDDGAGGRRAPRFGDMAVLLPALTHVVALEEELRGYNIPYVLEGGKFYYARAEVSSALTVLRAVANPNDQVAVYGALRSIFFGLSDEELLRARVAGIPFDYRAVPPEGSPLRRPYELLRDLHGGRLRRNPSETFERLLHGTGAREVLAARGFQSIANLNKLGRTLRFLQETTSFSDAVDRLQSMHEEGMAEAESRVMEEAADAVRILSIHKSKGLDFPIVLLAGLGAQRRRQSPDFLADPHGRKVFAVKAGGITPSGWEFLESEHEKREKQELIRLLYVALTRARDYLVVSLHHRGRKDPRSERWGADFKSTRLEPLAEFLVEKGCRDGNLAAFLDGRDLDGAITPIPDTPHETNDDWAVRMRLEIAELDRLREQTPLALPMQAAGGALGEARTGGYAPDDARERAIRLGVAYHEAMETADFFRPDRAGDWAAEASGRHQLDAVQAEVVKELVRKTLASPLIERARLAQSAGHSLFRELPYVRQLREDGAIEEGKIDLLFQEDNGWVLVDYKTDKPGEGLHALAGRYASQVGEYLGALRDVGLTVSAAYLLLARTGEAVEIPLMR